MKQKIGIIYSSVDGQTKKISETLHAQLREQHIDTKIYTISDFNADISEFHTLIIGASIRYGKHNQHVYEFIAKHENQLRSIQQHFSRLIS